MKKPLCLQKNRRRKTISTKGEGKKKLGNRRALLVQLSGFCIGFTERERARARELDREGGGRGWGVDGVEGREREREKNNKTKQEERINVGRACATAGKAECRFFFPPLSLQLSLSLSHSPSLTPPPVSSSNHRLSACQRAEGPPIWQRVAGGLSQCGRSQR